MDEALVRFQRSPAGNLSWRFLRKPRIVHRNTSVIGREQL